MIEQMERTKKYIITPDSIGFFKSILESYEDVGIFSVLDGKKGLIELIYSAPYEEDVKAIIADLQRYGIQFKEVLDV